MSAVLQNLIDQPYQHGFVTDIESETAPKGLSEDTIRLISHKKGEPEWLLEFRLKAYRHWLTMTEPRYFFTSSGCSCTASEIEQKMMPTSASFFL